MQTQREFDREKEVIYAQICFVGRLIFKPQKAQNRALGSVSLNWCPEEDSNFHDRKVTST